MTIFGYLISHILTWEFVFLRGMDFFSLISSQKILLYPWLSLNKCSIHVIKDLSFKKIKNRIQPVSYMIGYRIKNRMQFSIGYFNLTFIWFHKNWVGFFIKFGCLVALYHGCSIVTVSQCHMWRPGHSLCSVTCFNRSLNCFHCITIGYGVGSIALCWVVLGYQEEPGLILIHRIIPFRSVLLRIPLPSRGFMSYP